MSRLISIGNVSLFEHPPVNNPEYHYDKGVLFVYGYNIQLADKTIRAAKRFELPLAGYKIVGKYKPELIEDDFFHASLKEYSVDTENCVVFIQND